MGVQVLRDRRFSIPPRKPSSPRLVRGSIRGGESMSTRPRTTQWLVIMLAAVLTAAPVLYAADPQQLVIYHWWTAGGERQAMEVIFDAFTKEKRSNKIVDKTVDGGGWINIKIRPPCMA